MQVRETPLSGLVVIEPAVHRDSRGYFVETWHAARYEQAGLPATFVQDNQSRSLHGTLRGLHWQWRRPQGKLVRVIEGAVFDVGVDLRPESASFGKWFGLVLSAENFLQCYLPPGIAHGFCVTSEVAQIEYKCTDYYDPEGERGLIWNDPDVAIEWPLANPLLSDRDRTHPTLRELFAHAPRSR
jgi:dTDP-4-dehydrorhamnose 3,5-epimerase